MVGNRQLCLFNRILPHFTHPHVRAANILRNPPVAGEVPLRIADLKILNDRMGLALLIERAGLLRQLLSDHKSHALTQDFLRGGALWLIQPVSKLNRMPICLQDCDGTTNVMPIKNDQMSAVPKEKDFPILPVSDLVQSWVTKTGASDLF